MFLPGCWWVVFRCLKLGFSISALSLTSGFDFASNVAPISIKSSNCGCAVQAVTTLHPLGAFYRRNEIIHEAKEDINRYTKEHDDSSTLEPEKALRNGLGSWPSLPTSPNV
jgi:hypothetical protein